MKNFAAVLVRKFAILSVLGASLAYVSGVQATNHPFCCLSDCEGRCMNTYEECMYYCPSGDEWCEYECQVNARDCAQGCNMECDPAC